MRRSTASVAVPPEPTAAEAKHRRLLTDHERSGLSLRAFAAERGLSVGHLSWWRHELRRREEARRRSSTPALLPVRLTAAPIESSREEEVVLAFRGYVLRFPSSLAPTRVAALVHALEGGTC